MKIKKAFTLIELIIFMGIFSILIFILTDIFISSLKTKTSSESSAAINQDARFIFAKLTSDINNANSIISPDLGVSSSTLDLILYGIPETIRLNNNNIELITGGTTYVLNGINSRITNLAFTRLGNDLGKNTIRINLTLQSSAVVNKNPEIISLETTVGLR
ncbi:prepilin-type N-terminal cleavage/methylation domain-containing protein [Candidatus Roizmanbacteria bacterium]|nr:prepilin-type N-terminal cleavage/methylation domain-containing protein [Candidatus Roizmanbacteria bacterium]